jgi:hypothetical protein
VLTKSCFKPLENRSQTLTLKRRAYTRSAGRTPLSLVRTYGGGRTTGRTLCKWYSGRTEDQQMYATFRNTFWVIPGCMRHPLDYCAKTTERTLGLPDSRCSIRELVANFSYKQHVSPLISHACFLPLMCR